MNSDYTQNDGRNLNECYGDLSAVDRRVTNRDKAFFSSNDDFRLEASHEVLGDMGNMRVLHESISG
jgi:hypothetical protein